MTFLHFLPINGHKSALLIHNQSFLFRNIQGIIKDCNLGHFYITWLADKIQLFPCLFEDSTLLTRLTPTAVDGRRPLVKDNHQWKMTFGGRRPSVEDNLV